VLWVLIHVQKLRLLLIELEMGLEMGLEMELEMELEIDLYGFRMTLENI
jgi:hypothetical protein